MPAVDALQDFSLGQRVADEEGNRGTVRYLGPVASAKDPEAAWVGVEWDDPGRGKHDGSVVTTAGKIHRHFSCLKPGPTCASFLKPNKLDRGVSLMAVLHKRYVVPDAPLEAPNQVFENAYANTSRGGQKKIEFHGETQIRARQQIGRLEKVSLRGERVAWAGEEEVKEEASHLVEVDLQGNLWSDWEELGRMARQMPRLENLHLNSNLMRPLETPATPELRGSFQALRVLILNSCGLSSWATVLHVEECVPGLVELGLARNALGGQDLGTAWARRRARSEIHAPFHRLQRLDLSGTGLRDWEDEVAFLKTLPSLRALNLNENLLVEIPAGTVQTHGATHSALGFQALEALDLSCNLVESWSCLDALNLLPRLHSLRFAGNPLTRGMGQGEARQLLIARMGALRRLNGSEVSTKERADAEKSYLRRVAREWGRRRGSGDGQGEGANEVMLSEEECIHQLKLEHPRWWPLMEQHGESVGGGNGVERGDGASGLGSLAREMVLVRLVSMAPGSITQGPVERKLPGSLTVGQLKLLCQRLFKLEAAMQTLSLKADPQAPPSLLDTDEEALAYCGATSGCEIFMNERDLKQEAREKESRETAARERMLAQAEEAERVERMRRREVAREKQSVVAAVDAGGIGVRGGGDEERL